MSDFHSKPKGGARGSSPLRKGGRRRGAFTQEQGVTRFLMRAQPGAQGFGDGEGDQIIRNGQELARLLLDPPGGIGFAALGAGPVIAGVIDKMILAAVEAAVEVPTQSGSAATEDCLHCPAVGRQNR